MNKLCCFLVATALLATLSGLSLQGSVANAAAGLHASASSVVGQLARSDVPMPLPPCPAPSGWAGRVSIKRNMVCRTMAPALAVRNSLSCSCGNSRRSRQRSVRLPTPGYPWEIWGVLTGSLLPSTPVPHSLCSFFDRTIGTAVEGSVYFYSMTNNAAATMTTGRSQGSNCTFKAVEDMCVTSHDYFKGLIVVIATQFTLSHTYSSLYQKVFITHCRMCPDSLVVKSESDPSMVSNKSVPTSHSSEQQVPNCLLSV